MKLIAISGKRRSGKSTLAEVLHTQYGYYPLHLASPLKVMCKEHFGLSEAQVNGAAKETPTVYQQHGVFLSPRDIMIQMGQFYRSIEPNYWIKKLLLLASSLPEEAVVVVPDVRFKNEIALLIKYGAYLVRLERDESLTGIYIDDPSETQLDNFKDWHLKVPAEFNKDIHHLYQIASRIHAGFITTH